MCSLFKFLKYVLCLIAGTALAFTFFRTMMELGAAIQDGYSCVPRWFSANVHVVVLVMFGAWLINPRRNKVELISWLLFLSFPLFFALEANGVFGSASAHNLQKVGAFFAWVVATLTLVQTAASIYTRLKATGDASTV